MATTFQWQTGRKDGTGAFTDISGATSSTYTPSSADLVNFSFKVLADGVSSPAWGVVTNPSAGGQATLGTLTYGSAPITQSNQSLYHLWITGSAQVAVTKNLPGRSLVYMNPIEAPPAAYNYGVPYQTAIDNGWVLKDSVGNLLRTTSNPSAYVCDIGDVNYQNAWASNVQAAVTGYGVDGAFWDNVLLNIKGLITPQQYPVKYPNATSWFNAYKSFCANVGPKMKTAGQYHVGNVNGWYPAPTESLLGGADSGDAHVTLLNGVAQYLGGCFHEYYCLKINASAPDNLRSTGVQLYQQWDGWAQRYHRLCNTLGVDFVGSTPVASISDTRAMLYSKGSFYLEWDGGDSVLCMNIGSYNNTDPWHTAWTRNLGLPTAAKTTVGVGYMRTYQSGIVCVNPDPSSSQLFTLGGTYNRTDGSPVSSVTLTPVTAEILTS